MATQPPQPPTSISISVRAGLAALAGALIPTAISGGFGLLPVLGTVYAGASLALLAVAIVFAILPKVRWPLHLLALPFLVGSLLCGYLAFAEWRDDHPRLEVMLKIDKPSANGLIYHFNVKNTGTMEVAVLQTSQQVSEVRNGSLTSVKPRELGGNATMEVAGLPLSNLAVGSEVKLKVVYRSNGTIRTHESRFQAPIDFTAAAFPVGYTDEPTPLAMSERTEADQTDAILSQPRGAFQFGIREVLHGKSNYTYHAGGNKAIFFDPLHHTVQFEVIDTSGIPRGFLKKFEPAERHEIIVQWDDPSRAFLISVDGQGVVVIGDGEPQILPVTMGAPTPVF